MRKIKYKNIFKLLLIIIFIIFGGIYIKDYILNKESISSTSTEYSSDAISIASSLDIENKLYEYDYSKTLEEMLLNYLYIDTYFEDYLEIEFLEEDDFLNNVNLYLEKNYNATEVNNIFNLSSINQEKLKELEYTDFSKYKDFSNYDANNTIRYENYYSENNTLDLQTIVTYVNINLDLEFYEQITEVTDTTTYDILVNKFNALSSDYEPDNLVALENFSSIYMEQEAAEMFTLLIGAAETDGFTFEPTSAYRSYTWQNNLYTYYVSVDGEDVANTYSAKPGHSEHQTGLAVDIKNPTYYASTGTRLNDEDYAWILENSYKYGYIVRYPAESTDITGYMEEPWHLRYLGVELATEVYESGLTYDEYYDLYIKEY